VSKRKSGNFAFYEQRGRDWFCKTCGAQILAVVRYHSVWDGPGPCSGGGEVLTSNAPFCPNCEEKPSERGLPIMK
jgi:hypothetical protein